MEASRFSMCDDDGDTNPVRFSGDEKLNNVAAFVLESIESFTKKANSTGCDSTICKTKKKMLEFVDKKYNNKK